MAVPLKQLLADSKRLVARDLFDPANAEVIFTISSSDLPAFTLLATHKHSLLGSGATCSPFY